VRFRKWTNYLNRKYIAEFWNVGKMVNFCTMHTCNWRLPLRTRVGNCVNCMCHCLLIRIMVMPYAAVAAVFWVDRDYLASNTFCDRAKCTNTTNAPQQIRSLGNLVRSAAKRCSHCRFFAKCYVNHPWRTKRYVSIGISADAKCRFLSEWATHEIFCALCCRNFDVFPI